jgi:molybdate transport system substrate-binding protein
MRRIIPTTLLAALAMLASTGLAATDEVRLVSVGGVKTGLEHIIADFSKATGHKVIYTPGNPVLLPKQIQSTPYDVVVQSDAAMDETGTVISPGSRKPAVRGGIGMAAHPGASPDISTPDGFKKTLLAAKSIGVGNAQAPHGSGRVVQRVLVATGILDAVKDRLKVVGLEPGQKEIAAGTLDIGLVNASEVWSYVKYAGPVPAPFQAYTNYEVAVTTHGAASGAAAALAAFIVSRDAARHWTEARMEPSTK